MSDLPLSLACGDYDRTRALHDGTIGIDGCDVTAFALPPEEIFFRAFRHAEFDVAELSFSTYLITAAAGTCPYVAIPAFVSRAFRHSAIYVRKDGPVKTPAELKGRRVGVPEYQVTAAVWVRDFLERDFGVKPSDIDWITGGVEQPGRHEKTALGLLSGLSIEPAPDDATLNALLLDGAIDALVCPRAPSSFDGGTVRRLFGDPAGESARYYAKHKAFPIMHVVGIRQTLADRHPWLPGNVDKAFRAARDRAMAALTDATAPAISLPWLIEEVARTRALMGSDFWPYGVAQNRATLEAFLDAHHRQGLTPRRLGADEIFHPSTTERFKV